MPNLTATQLGAIMTQKFVHGTQDKIVQDLSTMFRVFCLYMYIEKVNLPPSQKGAGINICFTPNMTVTVAIKLIPIHLLQVK